MMEQQHKDCADIGAALAVLRKRLQILEDEREKSKGSAVSGARRWFRGRFMIFAIILLGMLSTGGLLYGQGASDALFIDKDGNVGIGTNAPKAQLDVAGTVKANEFTTTSGVSLSNVQTAVTRVQQNVNVLNLQVPIGTIMAYGGDTTNIDIVNRLREQGWLPCNGVSVSREEYKDLYNIIGTAFGSNSNTTFQVPDMRGLFLRGVDQGTGRDPDSKDRYSSPGGKNGDQVGSIQGDQFKMHKHAIKAKHADQTGGSSTGDPLAVAGWPKNPADKEVETTGGTETRPKNIYVNWIIKAKNILSSNP
jgi:microcystin-dependent protein